MTYECINVMHMHYAEDCRVVRNIAVSLSLCRMKQNANSENEFPTNYFLLYDNYNASVEIIYKRWAK